MFKSKVLVSLLIVTTVLAQDLKPVELDDLLAGKFHHKQLNTTWVSGNQLAFESDTDSEHFLFDVDSKQYTFLFGKELLDNYEGASITVTKGAKFAIIKYDVHAVFRHSITAKYAVYDIENKQTYDIANKELLQILVFAPEGSSIAYVLDNNIYYLSSPGANPVQITTNGIPGIVYNGVADWVYEEEILSSGKAMWFSPNGKRLAFATFDDTNVKEFNYLKYGQPDDPNNLYTEVVKLRYPKVGTTNPKFSLNVVDLTQSNVEIISCNATAVNSEDFILTDVTWPNNDDVVGVVNNRVQNNADVLRCNADSGICLVEAWFFQNNGWLELIGPVYNKAATHSLYVIAQQEGNDNFEHLVLYDVQTMKYERLTAGRKVVDGILSWDEDKKLVYYLGSVIDSPSQKQAYVVNTETKEDKCLTCDLLTPEGPCKYASASISTDNSHIIKTCSGPGPIYIVVESLNENGDQLVWEDNWELRTNLSSLSKMVIRDYDVDLGNGFIAKARLLLPPGLDESGQTKYPTIVNVYGGPSSNKIVDAFTYGVPDYFVTNRKYIYIYIDGRGSGRSGQNIKFAMYKKMATVEIEDQITVTKYLQETFPYIDRENTAIWGWSYGGFASAWVLVKDTEHVFKSALSVAPVTNFVLYDTMYTERYNGLLEENQLGYNNTDLTRNVEGFRNRTFFLIHGNADDNVHYQQAMLLVRALELADIPFLQQSYPDENHSLGGVSKHLYHTLDKFWADSFSSKSN